MSTKKKVILAYSGGLDTSVILHWLNNKGFDVTAVCFDLGQKVDNWESVVNRAKMSGASDVMVDDIREEFAQNYLIPCLQAHANYEGAYKLGTAMARPLIAKRQIDLAMQLGAEYVAHGATGKGNDQARFEIAYLSLNPKIKIIAPWKMPEFYNQYPGRNELIDYATQHGIKLTTTKQKPWSSDENLMHISFESGMLEDPAVKPLDEMFQLTKSPQAAPDKTTTLKISFEKGIPIAINDKSFKLVDLINELNRIAGLNGIGRADLVESRFIGMKSRGVYETPAGSLLMEAHRQLESIVLTFDVIELKNILMPRFAALVYRGLWFTPQMKLLLNLIKESQVQMSGDVTLELYKGNITTIGRSSPYCVYDMDIASMEKDEGNFNPQDAAGFIRLTALPFIINSKKQSLLSK